ncbi:MAG: NADP-dependent isocitrate dehydrogenase [Chloroflexi bacterium]|nr:NADP-dependent isocitrate dehydrogenase [Chloroflexota bacterium]BCY18234.1 isocitrate dehydrogenase [NADP] [Leptolinea sp. HRD-7]
MSKSDTTGNEQRILCENGRLNVPNTPTIPYIEGDGIGPDIWRAAKAVLNAAVEKAYNGSRAIIWKEVLAGEKAVNQLGNGLPEETLQAFRHYLVGMKGPMGTPVGGGARSLNVALRKELDLYVCQRPVRWFKGLPAPVVHPEHVNMVIFRENTEDVYAGIEFELGSEDNTKFAALLQENFPSQYAKVRFPKTSAFGIKPVSSEGSRRLVSSAIRYALTNGRKSVTLMHKGNIMKFTEGGFRKWGYAAAEEDFGDRVFTQLQWERIKADQGEDAANTVRETALAEGKVYIKDMIADAVFEAVLTRPQEFDVIASPNLNGDYLSDALAAQVGGIGIAPGANINDVTGAAVFEATHGTAPLFANTNKANPSSLILSGEMMLRYIGWQEAADLVIRGLEGALAARTVTFDIHRLIPDATLVSTDGFGESMIKAM